jgi:hypothetical protein
LGIAGRVVEKVKKKNEGKWNAKTCRSWRNRMHHAGAEIQSGLIADGEIFKQILFLMRKRANQSCSVGHFGRILCFMWWKIRSVLIADEILLLVQKSQSELY